jgi:hypothetical protein
VGFSPNPVGAEPYAWPRDEQFIQPGPENDYFRDYDRVDTISGIPGWSAPGTAVKGFLCQDNMVNETQGPLVDRRRERLGVHDQVLTAMRRMILDGIATVERGQDPKHILREPQSNNLVRVAGDEPSERA